MDRSAVCQVVIDWKRYLYMTSKQLTDRLVINVTTAKLMNTPHHHKVARQVGELGKRCLLQSRFNHFEHFIFFTAFSLSHFIPTTEWVVNLRRYLYSQLSHCALIFSSNVILSLLEIQNAVARYVYVWSLVANQRSAVVLPTSGYGNINTIATRQTE